MMLLTVAVLLLHTGTFLPAIVVKLQVINRIIRWLNYVLVLRKRVMTVSVDYCLGWNPWILK